MKIKEIKIENFRSIVECEFKFPDLLALIGENNVGKSNIICALELFFNKNKPDGEEDYFDSSKPIEITITFTNLTDFEKEKITEIHREKDDLFILKKIYPFGEDTKITSVKDDQETNIAPRGRQNVLADTIPELYLLPAICDVADEIKLTSSTNFGKFLSMILESNETGFEEIDEFLTQIKNKLESKEDDAPLNKAGIEISKILEQQFQIAAVTFKPKIINRKDILKSLEVFVHDGHDDLIYQKGHGLQRAFIFAIMRLWADKLNAKRPQEEKDKKDIIIAIEEPELYLHPHQQKIVYKILGNLAIQTKEQVQVIYTTHSSFLIHVEDYRNIGLVKKPTIEVGTKLTQYIEEIFSPDSKKEFSLLCQFDPERNEMFFARKIIFVEGDTEKMSLPLLLEKFKIDVIGQSISIVECGSKGEIKLFINVLSKFNEKEKLLDYIVIHDKDIPWKNKDDPKKKEKEKQAEWENNEIKGLCENSGIPSYVFDPDFERELKLEIGDENKPYRARKAMQEMDINNISQKLKDFLIDNLYPGQQKS